MSIKYCEIHGNWDTDRNFLSVGCKDCPYCLMLRHINAEYQKEEERKKPRKTLFGMTAVGWFLFLYIAAALIAMAWIVISHIPEAQ